MPRLLPPWPAAAAVLNAPSITLVRPWVVYCAGGAAVKPSGAAASPADRAAPTAVPAISTAPAGQSASGAADAADGAASEGFELEVFTSRPLAAGVHVAVVACEAHVRLRAGCTNEDAGAHCWRVLLPEPEDEGVWQVRGPVDYPYQR